MADLVSKLISVIGPVETFLLLLLLLLHAYDNSLHKPEYADGKKKMYILQIWNRLHTLLGCCGRDDSCCSRQTHFLTTKYILL